MVATFAKNALSYFREHHPAVRRVGHCGDVRKSPDEDCVPKLLWFRDQYGLYGVNIPAKPNVTKPEDVVRLRENGLWVSVWFVQNEKTAATYRAVADAFVTDFVSKARLPVSAR